MRENQTTEDTDAISSTEVSGSMTFDGEAWKNRDNVMYTSLLDMYGASDLFSSKSMEIYNKLGQEELAEQQELVNYIFSGRLNTEDNNDEELINYVFSNEIEFSKTKDYGKNENDYFICYVMSAALVVLVFVCLLINFDVRRKKRREKYAAEINMEN